VLDGWVAEWQRIESRMFYMTQEQRTEALDFLERSRFSGDLEAFNDFADPTMNDLRLVMNASAAAAESGKAGPDYARVMLVVSLGVNLRWLSEGNPAWILGAAKAAFSLNDKTLLHAEKDPVCFDVACTSVGIHIKCDLPLTRSAKEFAFRVLSDELKRPTQKGANPFSNLFRDRRIVEAIEIGQFYGLAATRNDASAETSGCDAVADFMRERGLKPQKFSAVKRIWLGRGDTDRRFSMTMQGSSAP
jgi:hypothetical protein